MCSSDWFPTIQQDIGVPGLANDCTTRDTKPGVNTTLKLGLGGRRRGYVGFKISRIQSF